MAYCIVNGFVPVAGIFSSFLIAIDVVRTAVVVDEIVVVGDGAVAAIGDVPESADGATSVSDAGGVGVAEDIVNTAPAPEFTSGNANSPAAVQEVAVGHDTEFKE